MTGVAKRLLFEQPSNSGFNEHHRKFVE